MRPIDFIKISLKDFKNVGAISITSKLAARRIIKEIKSDAKYIIEYGAGSGVITKEILKKLPSDGVLIVVEINKKLSAELHKIKDSRLQVITGDVVQVSRRLKDLGLPRIDSVISGIPFSFLKSAARREVIRSTYEALASGGQFIVYQISLVSLPAIKKLFRKVKYDLELRNIPPYFIIKGDK